MPKLVRKQIYIEDSQNRRLKSRAKNRHVSEAEIIRRGIDLALAAEITAKRDLRAWESQKAFIRKRMEHPVGPPSERWTKEELYDERLSR